MQLKRPSEIKMEDLPRIESPFFAEADIREVLGDSHVWRNLNMDEFLREFTTSRDDGNKYALRKLFEQIKEGSILLVQPEEPFVPVVKWVENPNDPAKGEWVPEDTLGSSLEFHIEMAICSANESAWVDTPYIEKEKQLKRIPNLQPVRSMGSMNSVDISSKAAVYTLVASTVNKVVVNSRSTSEALGKAGMEQAKTRLGHTTDPRYVDRYHGPDDMTQDKNGRLAEWEAKGNISDSTAVAKDEMGNMQGSSEKNSKRAWIMTGNKSKKIDVPSGRQGGPYTNDEIELWKIIRKQNGYKQHISSHTNTETGRVRVFERNSDGKLNTMLDEFNIDHFNELKRCIKEVL